jgi:membrane protein implicated in regulation of membrane protease activity
MMMMGKRNFMAGLQRRGKKTANSREVYGLKLCVLLQRKLNDPQCGVVNTSGSSNMAESTLWWLATGGVIVAELLTGTFYLLMLGIGCAAAALAAHLGLGLNGQMVLAALVGGGAVVAWHLRQMQRPTEAPAQSNANVNLDIGETVQIEAWNTDGTADVHYRGARWTAIHRPGVAPTTGPHRVAELVGNRLLVDKS